MHEFEKFWRENFFELGPFGYLLRARFNKRWVRFHALPNSKRYADSAQERETILERADTLAKDVLGGAECWLAITSPGHFASDESPVENAIKRHHLKNAFIWRDTEEAEIDPVDWLVYAAQTRWEKDKYSDLLLSIADDLCSHALWVSSENKSVFAPYDGGFDLIAPNADLASAMKAKYFDWLPGRPDGL